MVAIAPYTSALLTPILFGVGVAVLLAIIFALTKRYERKRREALSAAAMQMGFAFEAEGQPFPAENLEAMHLFTTGHTRETNNILRGRAEGMDAVLFDYKYVTGGGRSRAVHAQTVAAFHLERAKVPGFELRPENVLHRIAEAFGYQDIDFDDHPGFSSRYLLRGNDENAIRNFFSAPLISMFEALPPNKWSLEGQGDWLVIYAQGKRVDPAELPRFLQDTVSIASSFRHSAGAAKFGF